jgi:hypothetical protein
MFMWRLDEIRIGFHQNYCIDIALGMFGIKGVYNQKIGNSYNDTDTFI